MAGKTLHVLPRKPQRRMEQSVLEQTGAAESEATVEGRPATAVKSSRTRGREIKRGNGQVFRATTAYLPPALYKRLGYYCVDTDKDKSGVIVEALERFLEEANASFNAQ